MRVDFHGIKVLLWTVLTLLSLSTPQLAKAAEWAAAPSLRAGLEFNDNPQLTTQPHDSVHGYNISPRLDLSVNSEIWRVDGGMEATRVRYPGNSNLDRDDQRYDLATSYNTERSTWRVIASRSESSTISEEQPIPNTGLVEVPIIYDSHSISPSWTWSMSELTNLELSYSVSEFSYVNGQSSGLYDYSTREVSAQLAHKIDLKDQVFFTTGYSSYNVPTTGFESNSDTYQAGITRDFSETMQGTLNAGLRRTSNQSDVVVCTLFFGPFCLQTGTVTQSSSYTSTVYSGSLEKKYETVRLKLSVNRSYDPSGLGTVVLSDSQDASLTKTFTSRLKGIVSASNYNYSQQTSGVSDVKRHYYSYVTGLFWLWTQELSVDLRYKYAHVKRVTDEQSAASNAIYLTIGYQWPKIAISR